MARDFSINPQYMADDQGRPHWHKDWSPSPEHAAAIKGTPQQRRQWFDEEVAMIEEGMRLEEQGKFAGAGQEIVKRYVRLKK